MKKAFVLAILILSVIFGAGIYYSKVVVAPQNTSDNSPVPSATNIPITTPSPVPTSTPLPTPSKLTMSFAGDVIFDSWVGSLIDNSGHEQIISGLGGIFKESDLSVINLETPISLRGTKENDKQFTFRAKPEYIKVLTEAGINTVTLANNHILDYGHDALKDTLDILKSNNINYVGAGENLDEASKPLYITKNGTTVAIIGSSHVIPFVTWAAEAARPGVATTYDPARLTSEIGKARQKADIVIVYVHWGEEMKTMPIPYQKNLAKIYIDKGADIVIGSHPHVLQGIEFYKTGVICYSLGNFIFTNTKKDTAIINFEIINKKIADIKVIPCEIINFKTSLVKDNKKALEIFNDLKSISFGIDIQDNGSVIRKLE